MNSESKVKQKRESMGENLTRVEISKSAVSENIENFRKVLNKKTLFCAIIKSNAYGHGLLEMADLSLSAGADLLGVNSMDEALILRKKYPSVRILIMGEIPFKENRKKEIADDNFWIVVSRLEDIQFLSNLHPRPKIHLKIDTGMSRLGFSGTALEELIIAISTQKLPLDGALTHFASTEDFTEHSYSMQQLSEFTKALELLTSLGYKDLIRHTASSASTMLFEEARLDMVRVGISLYGLWPSMETRLSLSFMGKDFQLKPVLSWKTGIVHIQSVPAGRSVGYGSTYKTIYPTKIAVIPVGYFEGYDRRLSNQGYALIDGERAPILGRVCMNMTMLNVTHIPTAELGKEVTLIGKSGSEEITADWMGNLTGTINYDIVTSIQKDIQRIIVP
jgi:alanine racemase